MPARLGRPCSQRAGHNMLSRPFLKAQSPLLGVGVERRRQGLATTAPHPLAVKSRHMRRCAGAQGRRGCPGPVAVWSTPYGQVSRAVCPVPLLPPVRSTRQRRAGGKRESRRPLNVRRSRKSGVEEKKRKK